MAKRLLRHTFSLLHIERVRLTEKWNYTNVISPYFRIYYIDDGEGYVYCDNEKIRLEPGNLYIIPSFTLCHLHCDNYLSQYFLHFIEESADGVSLFENNRKMIKLAANKTDITSFKRLLEINPGRGINRSDNPKVYEKNSYYSSYQELNNHLSDAVFFETQGIILQIISRFLGSRSFNKPNVDPIPSKIVESMHFIQLNLMEDLSVGYLAKRANLNQDYFSRLFFQATGERPLEYIHSKRIERAQYLIATTNLSFNEIANQTGFDNVHHFSRIFKNITSITPGKYKKANELIYSA